MNKMYKRRAEVKFHIREISDGLVVRFLLQFQTWWADPGVLEPTCVLLGRQSQGTIVFAIQKAKALIRRPVSKLYELTL